MFSGKPLRRIAAWCSLACLALSAGCAAPVIRSQRLAAEPKAYGPVAAPDCQSCENRQRLRDLAPYVAGPFVHESAQPYTVQQATIQPPHSKFHPVPTRPVFESSPTYSPPQPIGVQLVPIPEHSLGPGSDAPAVLFPDIGLPPIVEELPLTPVPGNGETMLLPDPDGA